MEEVAGLPGEALLLLVQYCFPEAATDAGGHAFRPRVVVLRIAVVGDDHVGRNLEITLTGGLGGYVASFVHCINMLGCFHNAGFAVLLYRHHLGER